MKQPQQEKNVEFNFLSDKYNKLNEKIEKKPFKKIAFLGVAIGFGILLSYQTVAGLGSAFNSLAESVQQSENESQAKSQAEVTKIAKSIKTIPLEEMKNFLLYMKVQQNIYDEKVAFVTDNLIKAESTWTGGGNFVAGLEHSKELNNNLTDHKKAMGDLITQHQQVYRSVMNDDLKTLSVNDIKAFMQSFESYTANVTIHNADLEKIINEKIFIDEEGNKQYNTKNNILDKIKVVDKNIENATNSVKPKM